MRVITALGSDFDRLCDELAKTVINDYSPDLIIGIATGGEFVARAVAKNIDAPVMIIKRQRKLTKYKSRFKISKLLALFPRWLNDILRKVEIKNNERKFIAKGKVWTPSDVVVISGDLDSLSQYKKVLLVDDSVDSGSTMVDSIKFIQDYLAEGTALKTAALNVTFSEPVLTPDFYLYKDTLIRCPWANDVGKRK